MKNKKIFDIIIYILLLLSPIFDALTCIMLKNNIELSSISSIIRGILLLLVLIWLCRYKKNRSLIIIFFVYLIIYMINIIFKEEFNIFVELSNVLKIFYLPFLILFFSQYENDKINGKIIFIIYLLYVNLIVIPFIFGFGYDISSSYSNKKGYFGLFYSGNEISSVIICLLPIIITYLKRYNIIIKALVVIETIICIILIGTKSLLLGTIIIGLYFFIKYFKKIKSFIGIKRLTMFLIISLSLFFIIFLKMPVYKNLVTTLNFYDINSVNDLIDIENIDNIIFSKRISFLNKINKIYVISDVNDKLFGLGRENILNIKDIEIDIFDIFYSIGIIGTICYLYLMIYILKNSKLNGVYKFSFILLLIISLFSGHILISPMVSAYLALLFYFKKTSNETKRILLVSNMYPSKKYKFYGTFVKNTEEILMDNGYYVDKVVIHKNTNKYIKLISYIRLYLLTIIKCMFNEFDYIYVHFISHSSLGAVIVKKINKKIKLVLNAHGNDVVYDNDFEIKNINRSKKYLKYADKIIVPSKYYKKIIKNNYNIDDEKIFIYPSGGVNTKKFVNKEKNMCKKKCNLDFKYSYIGYISRIEKDKGWNIFLKSIKELEKENNIENKKFLIIGMGQEIDKMNELIKKLDISKYLEIRNMVSQDELVYIYNSLDIFVFPTYRKSESLGLVGLEAMSCETFVIASNNYGPTDYIQDGVNGFLFVPKDEKDLKNKIIEYENLKINKKRKIIDNARKTAEMYDSKKTKDNLIKVFE